ncbi:MAG: sulfate ABC transporter substrate-binding protein [Anaerolineales bacterium]
MYTFLSTITDVRRVARFTSILILAALLVACAGGSGSVDSSKRIVLAAYTTPREAYREIIPLFTTHWKELTGEEVVFEESYLGSGAQSRAIVEGFEADIAALSLAGDVTRIQRAGLITHDWTDAPFNGMVSTSIVSLAVRQGNPENIQDWHDLASPGLNVLTPNPRTSGGAMWNVMGLYGAAKRGYVEGYPANDDQAAQDFLLAVLKNVSVMDGSARESITNFEKGVGDVAITYENEILVGHQAGQTYDLVIPRSTLLIENPIAVIDVNVDKHGNRELVEAFVEFLFRHEIQEIFARHGLRSPDPQVAQATVDMYPPVEDLFTIEYFGGWSAVMEDYFSDDGIYTQVVQRWQGASP